MIVAQPTWDNDIRPLFGAPYWLPAEDRARIADRWRNCMTAYFVDLADYASVRTWSETIYNHLASRSIPLTTDARQFWPLDALETFRLWVNQGWRRTPADPFDNATRLPKPSSPYPPPYLRHDLASMSPAEIDDFRARLDDIMRVTDPSPSSPWQKWAYVHTNWCLHYQEAFAFWHRGFLLYLEAMLGCPVPIGTGWPRMPARTAAPRPDCRGVSWTRPISIPAPANGGRTRCAMPRRRMDSRNSAQRTVSPGRIAVTCSATRCSIPPATITVPSVRPCSQ